MIGEHRRLYPDTARTLAYGLLGGLTLGIAARAWMRLIAEKPAFSWKGSIFIVLGFTVFGLTQSIVAVARARATRRWRLTIVRVIGFVGMLPLFMAAGALMFPTVVGGGLGLARADWRRATRVMCVAAGTGSVVFVARDVVHTFGWSFRAAAGLVGLLCIYSAITLATRFTFAPQTDGWRLPRWARPVIVVASGLLLVVAVVGGGGLK